MKTYRSGSARYPRGNDLIHSCQSYGLADVHDHSFPEPGVIRFWAVPYCPALRHLAVAEFEARFRRGGGIRITQITPNN